MFKAFFLISLVLCSALSTSLSAEQHWFPVEVQADGLALEYQPLEKTSKAWRLCALLPHGKDHYWWGVSWGLAEEAKRQGVQLGIYEAGGYENLPRQRQQLLDCVSNKADALIISAISSEGLNDLILQLKEAGIPVIDLINGINSDAISARSSVSFADMASQSMLYLLQHSQQRTIDLAWFPGPAQAAWVQDAERGLKQRVQGSEVTLLHGGYGATDNFSQATLVRQLFSRDQPHYVLANAVAAAVAQNFLSAERLTKIAVMAYYANPEVIRLIQEGQLLAAATDSPVIQARISIDLALRILEKQAYARQVSPQIRILDQHNIKLLSLQQIIAPKQQWMIRQPLAAQSP
ncbi:MAG: TMAO reductase system periplasmic protein TorT [Gammaproteobacteria bacterium]|nr:TMAO reductase system periplasmic protein TorT [Gammaproteobacteria bacterium]MBU2058308.1 TMAO reductase system periplasmic protein TorT [Gammaproteobacteria bacterium]MBU2176639.1 TMAO reductase system periplasmic protein TorT [Gammaproteobacteria bacterium]MBU2248419.1 TMAO reductase system periplasmic protein TorT [Gammaproteobacteria bacterium]MBU2345718.1 TMAO reductase system periplasmic protein TorT [Gammaproteobacteria bacterium]